MAKVVSRPTSIQVANAVGEHVLSLQNAAIDSRGVFRIAVSGGSLGKVLKKALIDNEAIAPLVQWSKWEVFFSDERLVPLAHPDSNYGLFNEMVLQHLSTKPVVYTIDESLLTGTDGLNEGADEEKDRQIAEAYEKLMPSDPLDLVLLGCGPDGHTCSLFPGHPLLEERKKLIAHISDSPKPPPRRITFTFPVLERASSIAFVAEGAGKKEILREIFVGESRLPSRLVNERGGDVRWFVDEAAKY